MYQSIALWTIRTSIACYVLTVGLKFYGRTSLSTEDTQRGLAERIQTGLWIMGACLCVVHVVTAMGAFHHFSHAESIRHTAEMTEKVVGINWGGGVYVNYLFTGLWLWDSIRQFRNVKHTTPVWLHVFMGFIVFNATAVFGPGWYRWPTALVAVGITFAWWYRRRR